MPVPETGTPIMPLTLRAVGPNQLRHAGSLPCLGDCARNLYVLTDLRVGKVEDGFDYFDLRRR
eukprot:809125-Pyramimonas_sp.AAC.1